MKRLVVEGTPEPPAKRPATSPNVKTNQKWNFAKNQVVPQALRAKKVSKCSLEFINVGPSDSKNPNDNRRLNHSVIRLTLKHAPENNTPYAPADTQSLLLDMAIDPKYDTPEYTDAASLPVELLLKTCIYKGEHRDALKIVDLPMNRNKTVRDFLNVIETSSLTACEFVPEREYLVGCRDYMWVFSLL